MPYEARMPGHLAAVAGTSWYPCCPHAAETQGNQGQPYRIQMPMVTVCRLAAGNPTPPPRALKGDRENRKDLLSTHSMITTPNRQGEPRAPWSRQSSARTSNLLKAALTAQHQYRQLFKSQMLLQRGSLHERTPDTQLVGACPCATCLAWVCANALPPTATLTSSP